MTPRMPRIGIHLRFGVLLGLAIAVSGCVSPSRGLLVPVPAPATAGHTRTLLAVTTRQPAAAGPPGYLYSGERGETTRFVRLTLSMPPGRVAGTVPTDAEHPDPAKHITLVSASEVGQAGFASLAEGDVMAAKGGGRALVFIHGYNTQFDEAVVRFAQIVDDTQFVGLPILFSWPSRGNTGDYGYDKDSANYSRDAMVSLLMALAREPGISGIDVFAHSMGNWLTMEALRQLAVAGDQQTLGRLGAIVLAAPDIDMDVFRAQLAWLGPLRSHMMVYASEDDYALRISRRLFGGKIRAGENTDLDQFRVLGIEANNLSDVDGGIGRNHAKALGDGATIASIGQALADAPTRQDANLLDGALQTLRSPVTELLPPSVNGSGR